MAMINCPECGVQISDQAYACPACGYPISVQRTPPMQNAVYTQQAQQTPNAVPMQQVSPMQNAPYQGYAPMPNTVPMQAMPQYGQQRSGVYPQIRAYADTAKNIYTLSIVGLILCMGIGFIFAIVNLSRINKLTPIGEPIYDPYELAVYQAAQKKLNTAKTLSGVTLIGAGLAVILGFIIGVVSQM